MKKTWIYILIVIVVIFVLIVVFSNRGTTVEEPEETALPEGELSEEGFEETFEQELQRVSLTELEPIGYQQWGELGINKSVLGNDLKVGGVEYEKGLGAHAYSVYTYAVEGYNYFEADIGLDDGVTGDNVAVFVVKGDGEELYRSDAMKPGDTAVSIRVLISGIKALSLITEDGGDGMNADVTNWLNPVLIP